MSKASFVIQKESYSPEEMEAAIEDLEKELEDEEKADVAMSGETQAKIDAAKAFIADYGYLIEAQDERIQDLNDKIRALVSSNEEKLVLDQEYKDLIESSEYETVANQLFRMKTTIDALDKYLIKKNRRGRPPLPSV